MFQLGVGQPLDLIAPISNSSSSWMFVFVLVPSCYCSLYYRATFDKAGGTNQLTCANSIGPNANKAPLLYFSEELKPKVAKKSHPKYSNIKLRIRVSTLVECLGMVGN